MTSFVNIFSEAAIFALYIFICLVLMKPRFSLKTRILAYGGVLLCVGGAVMAVSVWVNVMAALTLLPLIAYLPFSICAYILSEGGLFETAAACSVGALGAAAVKTFKRILFFLLNDALGRMSEIVILLLVLLLTAAAAFVAVRFIRKPFALCAETDMKSRRLVLVPAAAVFLLLFISLSGASQPVLQVTALIIGVSFFTMAALLFTYSAKTVQAEESERRLAESLALQRKNFEQIMQSVDSGRFYRHDMRHHLTTLAGMARQNNSTEILEYIEKLNENTELGTGEIYCKNPAINAVLSEYMSRGEKIGCDMEYKIYVPDELPFDLPDVCVILSNALENALNACDKCDENKRYINLLAEFSEDCKLKIMVKNSCSHDVKIDGHGLPVVEKRTEGHGIGLRSVRKIAEAYNGFVCCTCEKGEFAFCAEIFHAPKRDNAAAEGLANNADVKFRYKHSKALPAVITLAVCGACILNFSPSTANALSEALSIDIKTLSYGWEGMSFNAVYPEFSGDNSGKLNQAADSFIETAMGIFRSYTLQKYEGYAGSDAGFRVYRNDRKYLSARFYATINLGGSMEYSRCVTIDKESGQEIALSDLFDKNYDYIGEISAEVIRQMERRNEFDQGKPYFVPGGIWSDEECFKEISPRQQFYLTPYGELVIVFDEYEVAAGSVGAPEFMMPAEIFHQDSGNAFQDDF